MRPTAATSGGRTSRAGRRRAIIHAGLAVPLPGESSTLGYLTVFTRQKGHSYAEHDLRQLETLALRAGPAIENARRFREARQMADLDALTGLHNRRFFHETLARECARAHRYERKLSLIVFDLDDFKEINDRIGHLAGDAVLSEAAERVRDVVRTADIACRVGGDEFAVILPESSLEDADQLYSRIQSAVSARPIGQAGKLFLSAGVAELRAEDDPVSFFQRADDALYRAKEAGKGRVVVGQRAAPRPRLALFNRYRLSSGPFRVPRGRVPRFPARRRRVARAIRPTGMAVKAGVRPRYFGPRSLRAPSSRRMCDAYSPRRG